MTHSLPLAGLRCILRFLLGPRGTLHGRNAMCLLFFVRFIRPSQRSAKKGQGGNKRLTDGSSQAAAAACVAILAGYHTRIEVNYLKKNRPHKLKHGSKQLMRHKRNSSNTVTLNSQIKQLFLLAAESISRLGGSRETSALQVTPPDLGQARVEGGGVQGVGQVTSLQKENRLKQESGCQRSLATGMVSRRKTGCKLQLFNTCLCEDIQQHPSICLSIHPLFIIPLTKALCSCHLSTNKSRVILYVGEKEWEFSSHFLSPFSHLRSLSHEVGKRKRV